MSLQSPFHAAASGEALPISKRRPAPFSLRLSEAERARLADEARGAPLGAYIKAKLLGGAVPVRMRRTGLAVEDRQSLAKALALLGASRLASNLNQLAHLAHVGALPVTPETEGELREGVGHVRAIRRLLLAALGLKPEGGPA
ncbi:hypothetical protein [Siccirubricoccus phaeus]|uniref:hypothetical protein n=1 Tax=Siccirubricoccus phaeus TaxID=2595053 RepID=UPI0011F0F320|nr:hypothetical protein [Siccirubricoccus phaeus]